MRKLKIALINITSTYEQKFYPVDNCSIYVGNKDLISEMNKILQEEHQKLLTVITENTRQRFSKELGINIKSMEIKYSEEN